MYVQLIEPDGTPNITVTRDYAIEYCKNNPGWSWAEVESLDKQI
jgi:hypothetical protein